MKISDISSAFLALPLSAAVLVGCGGSGSSSTASAQNEWVWMGGSQNLNAAGSYGMQDAAAAGNSPGARSGSAFWTDAQGNFWLFGGIGYDANTALGGLNDLWKYSGSQWTWVTGSDTSPGPAVPGGLGYSTLYGNIGAHGAYGTMGVAGAANTPGARSGSAHWTDAQGNLWLFGGSGTDAVGNWTVLDDLWKFSPFSGQWTWMGGPSTVSATPKGVYGAMGVAAATNLPGPRSNAAAWTDTQGNLWLFGGIGYDSTGKDGYLEDVWIYANGQWTWVNGATYANMPYSFSQQGTASTSATPGGRSDMITWSDGKGNLWLYGGESYTTAPPTRINYWADLWMFSPSSGLWTWVGGSSTPNQGTNFGQMGVAAAGNTPGSREGSATWIDASGNLWLFGGTVHNGDMPNPIYPDMWEYSPSNGQWTWMEGTQSGTGGVFGQIGVADSKNIPTIRANAAAWTNSSGQFLLFGGDTPGGGALTDSGIPFPNTALNDLWEYTP